MIVVNNNKQIEVQNGFIFDIPPPTPPLEFGLVGKWLFNQATSSSKTILDQKGSNNIVFPNALTFTADHKGTSNAALVGNDSIGLSVNKFGNVAGNKSISFWTRCNPMATEGIISISSSANFGFYYFFNGNIYFNGSPDGFAIPTNTSWHQLVFVREGTTETLYKDGSYFNQNTNQNPTFADDYLYIGSFNGGYTWTSKQTISDVRYWNRALSSGEITTLYNE